MSKEVAKRRSDELLTILEGVARDDAAVVRMERKAFSVGRATLIRIELMEAQEQDGALLALGWSREEFEIACEARRSSADSSVALKHAHERTGMRIRQAVEQAPKTLNVAIMMPAPQQMTPEQRSRAPIIDVSSGDS